MSYETIDTVVVTNAPRTESVRVSATIGGDGRHALLYSSRDFRVTLFGPQPDFVTAFNETIASLSGDSNMLDELVQFTDKYAS